MESKRLRVVLSAALVAAVVVFLLPRGNPDERRIRKRLARAVEVVEVAERESALVAAARGRALAGLVTEDVTVVIERVPGSIQSRRELASLATQWRTQMDELAIAVSDIEVTVEPNRAEASTTLSAETVVRGWGEKAREYIDLAFTWKKVDGEWFIHRVEEVQAVRRPETLAGSILEE